MNIEQPPTFAKKSTNKKRLAKELAAYTEELAAGRWQDPSVIHVDITRNVMEQLDDITLGETPSPTAEEAEESTHNNQVAPIIDTIRIHFAADKTEAGETLYILESGVDQSIDVSDIPTHILKEIIEEAREDSDHALWEPLRAADDTQDISDIDAADMLYSATLSRTEAIDYKITESGRIYDYSLQHGYVLNDELVKDVAYRLSDQPSQPRRVISYGDTAKTYDTVTPDLTPLTDDDITRQLPELYTNIKYHSLESEAHDLVDESSFQRNEHTRRALGIVTLLRGTAGA